MHVNCHCMSFLIKFRYGDQNWWQNIFFLFGTEEFKANDRSLCPAEVGWLLVSRRDIFKENMVSQLTMPLQWLLDSLDEDPVKEEVSTSVDFWSIVQPTRHFAASGDDTDNTNASVFSQTEADRNEESRVLEKLGKYIERSSSACDTRNISFGEIKAENEDMEYKAKDSECETEAMDERVTDNIDVNKKDGEEIAHLTDQQTDLENRTKSIFDKVQSHLLKQRQSCFNSAKPEYMDKLGAFTGFLCPNCGRRFASKDYLKTHVDHCMNPDLKLKREIQTWVEGEVKNFNKTKLKRENGSTGGPCGLCEECRSFCGNCVHCRQMPKFGGDKPNRNACQKRKYKCEKVKKEKKSKVVTYDCNICGKTYENLFEGQSAELCEKIKHRALNHIRRCKYKLLEPNFSCTLCGNKFKAKALLNTHTRRYHRKPYNCDQCDHSTGTNYDLQRHKDFKHNGTLFTCEICGQTLAYETGLKNHMRRVHSGVSFNCDKCNHSSNTKDNLERHKVNMHSGFVFECDMCSSQYHSPSALGSHTKMEHGDLEYLSCDLCPFKNKDKNSLKKHKVSVHDKKQLSCKSCEFTSTQNSTILTHTKTVHQNIFFCCDQCKVKYPKKSTLQYHMDVKHGDGDTYQCDGCPKTTNHKYALQVHKRKYHKILASDQQKCGKCDFSTTLKVRMVQHQGREHNVTIKKCKECDYTSKYKKVVEDHVMLKHRGLGYVCCICGMKKSRKQYLTEHMAKVHTSENTTI